MHKITCPYIYTKFRVVHGVTSTDDSTVNTFVQGTTNGYDKYGKYETKQDIVTYTVGKIRKGIRYVDALHQGL